MLVLTIDWEIVSIVIAVLAIIISIWDRIANNKANNKTDKKAEEAIKIAQGSIEIEIRSSISNARQRLDDFGLSFKKLKSETPDVDLSYQEKFFYSIVEDFINQYDKACMLYLDNKIDKKRFEKEYKKEIQNVVRNKNYKKKYFKKSNPRFESLVEVYQLLK